MRSHYEKDTARKNSPFYSEEIGNLEKNKKMSNIKLLSELPFFPKEPKN